MIDTCEFNCGVVNWDFNYWVLIMIWEVYNWQEFCDDNIEFIYVWLRILLALCTPMNIVGFY